MRRVAFDPRRVAEAAAWPLLIAAVLAASGILAPIDLAFYDFALRHWHRPPSERIAIVAIDDRSIDALGRWPWSRRVHARLLDRLHAAGTRGVALDLILDQPRPEDAGADDDLRRALAAHGGVVLPVFPEGGAASGLHEVRPIAAFEQAAAGLGHTDIELDHDGFTRRIFLRAGVGTARWPALAAALLGTDPDRRAAGAAGRPAPRADARDADALRRDWVRDGEWMIPYAARRDGAPRIRQLSYVDVLDDPGVAHSLAGAYVLVGATATGLQAGFPTPVSGHGPPPAGIQIQAEVLDGLVAGIDVRPIAWPWQAVLLGLLALLPAASVAGLRARSALLVLAAWLPATVAISAAILYRGGAWFGPTANLAALVAAYPLLTWRRLERAARSLDQEQERSRATLLAISDAVVATDRAGRVTFTNPVAERLCRGAGAAARGRAIGSLFEFVRAADAARLQAAVLECVATGEPAKLASNLSIVDHARGCRELRVSASAIRGLGGRIDGVVVALSDVTETVAMTASIEHQATHDPLTGLPNRALLAARLAHGLEAAQRAGTSVAVVFVDLDDFKRVNDGFGHATGDALLRQVAQRLAGGARAKDTVARWGGDEFIIVAEDLPSTDAAAGLAQKIAERLRLPFDVEGQLHRVTASLGVSLFPKDGADAETLVQNADRAMYIAKNEGRDQLKFFSDAIHRRALERREIEAGLRRALANGEFEIYVQAQVGREGRAIDGAELLLRWHHPDGRTREPGEFIAVAEQSDLIHEIGEWVLAAACEHLAACRAAGVRSVPVSVNISARQLAGRDLALALRRRLDLSGVDPALLKLEVTESAVMHDLDRAAATLAAVRGLGVAISIDDFGTGYSSFSYLRRFPIDELKIDRSFVRNVALDPTDTAISAGVIAIAHSLRCRVVAEGVESHAQYAFLRERGCDAFQGYYFARPMPTREFIGSLSANAPAAAPAQARGPRHRPPRAPAGN